MCKLSILGKSGATYEYTSLSVEKYTPKYLTDRVLSTTDSQETRGQLAANGAISTRTELTLSFLREDLYKWSLMSLHEDKIQFKMDADIFGTGQAPVYFCRIDDI